MNITWLWEEVEKLESFKISSVSSCRSSKDCSIQQNDSPEEKKKFDPWKWEFYFLEGDKRPKGKQVLKMLNNNLLLRRKRELETIQSCKMRFQFSGHR